jgi:hypothetical protein
MNSATLFMNDAPLAFPVLCLPPPLLALTHFCHFFTLSGGEHHKNYSLMVGTFSPQDEKASGEAVRGMARRWCRNKVPNTQNYL